MTMNKIQYIELLKLRGIEELNGQTLAEALMTSGGEASQEELVIVNYKAMLHYINKNSENELKIEKLIEKNTSLNKDAKLLAALQATGVDNWEGYDIAQDLLEE